MLIRCFQYIVIIYLFIFISDVVVFIIWAPLILLHLNPEESEIQASLFFTENRLKGFVRGFIYKEDLKVMKTLTFTYFYYTQSAIPFSS